MKHLALAAALLALPLAARAQSWAQGVDCQANTVGSTLVATTDANGNITTTGNPGTPGYDCIMDMSVITMGQMPIAAWQYQVRPPLTRVWAGDDPSAPKATVELQFSDANTAQTVLSSLYTPPVP